MAHETTAPADTELSPAPYRLPDGFLDRVSDRVTAPDGADRQRCVTPMTGRSLGTLPVSDEDAVERAYRNARSAQTGWADIPVGERASWLLRVHDLVLRHQDELMDLIQLESGKTRRQAFEEVLDTVGVCRHYARRGPSLLAPRRHQGAVPLLTAATELHHPRGVIGIVAPWNYPLSMSITDALPALLAGNAVVLRPDEKAALTALRVVELLDEAGLPRGVLQVVLGDGPGVGGAVLSRADYVMFTGSTATGRIVARDAGERLVGASLELGGKNPMYVAEDADLDRAAECAVRSVYSSAGQLCISIERLLVHEDVADDFTRRFLARVEKMRQGVDLDWGNDIGSLISADQLERVQAHVDDAREHGATVLAGGRARPDIGPWCYEPTVLDGVTEAMRCCREETFGPVVSIYRVGSDAEAVERANDTEYGLNASVWTRDLARGRSLARQVHAGTVNVNEGYVSAYASNGSPMGGMGQSGLGRRHGADGLLKYTEPQTVAVQHGTPFRVPRVVGEKRWAAALSASMKLMKAVRLP